MSSAALWTKILIETGLSEICGKTYLDVPFHAAQDADGNIFVGAVYELSQLQYSMALNVVEGIHKGEVSLQLPRPMSAYPWLWEFISTFAQLLLTVKKAVVSQSIWLVFVSPELYSHRLGRL
jgi:hypothetical protein